MLKVWSNSFGITVKQLCGLFIHLEYYQIDRQLANLGSSLFFDRDPSLLKHEVSLDEAIWLMERGHLSEAVYQEVRLRFLDRIKFPPLYKVAQISQERRPVIQEFHNGVKLNLQDALKSTLLENLQATNFSETVKDIANPQVVFSFNHGLDGSGQHKNYNQMDKRHFTTENIMSVCFRVDKIKVISSETEVIIYDSTVQGANKPSNVRPWFIFPGKENDDLLKEIMPLIDLEVNHVKQNGIRLEVDDVEWHIQVEKATLSMVDGKMIVRLLQVGGAYCTMCDKSGPECHNADCILEGNAITRCVNDIKENALSLVDEDGDISIGVGDYESRKGSTGIPLTDQDVAKELPVTHAKLCSMKWLINLLNRERGSQKWSAHWDQIRYSEKEKAKNKREEEFVKTYFHDNLALDIGDAKSMVTGEVFKRITSDLGRETIVKLVHPSKQQAFSQILVGLFTIVLIINSQKRTIDIHSLKEVGIETLVLIVKTFPWAKISPSVHRILAHGWEKIQWNGEKGLGNLSEEGLEANNKFIRFFRARRSRTNSTLNNFTDTFNHLWRRSSPIIVNLERVKRKNRPKVFVQKEFEAFVESFFLE